ncbi:unnamed protein product [Schistosoma intercalatum]|nr:unnamed protein product [Schistosoma intercalatum]CAH8452939.1 unnamed protein product [Schistosoma intercalatum]
MNSFYHNLPKIELHAHLSGSISSAFLKRESITNRDVQNINPSFDFETWNGDMNRCFDAFRTIHKLIETPEILERVCIFGIIVYLPFDKHASQSVTT